MFQVIEVEDHIRVEPKHFGLQTREAIEKQLNESYVDKVNKELGYVIAVISVDSVEDGVIIPGDGAAFYKSLFKKINNGINLACLGEKGGIIFIADLYCPNAIILIGEISKE